MYVITVASSSGRGKHAKDLAMKIGLFLKSDDVRTMGLPGTRGYKVALYEEELHRPVPHPPVGADVYVIVKPRIDESWDIAETESEATNV